MRVSVGYQFEGDLSVGTLSAKHPESRRAIFLGDLIDRGPKNPEVLSLVMAMVETGAAFCVPGNHDVKLARKLKGQQVKMGHGLAETLEQINPLPQAFKAKVAGFLYGLVSHAVLDDGKLVAAHAGLREEMQGRASAAVRDFCLYGETTGEIDEYGLPVRYPWAAEYRGKAAVVYGHTPVLEAEWVNNTICIDTGCVFGGKLTALRYPERELVSIPAHREYYVSEKPLTSPSVPMLSSQQTLDDMLNLEDVFGKKIISTSLNRTVTLRDENSAAALEVMSRFAANPKWLIYLPPTMSPSETSQQEGYLESPREAFEYYRRQGVQSVVCEQKHMGSRAVVIVCRDAEAAQKRFGVLAEEPGIIYTRTGRRFFETDLGSEHSVLAIVHAALDKAGFWEEFQTEWFCLDCELMPWSAKAQDLLARQYAPVRSAGESSLLAEAEILGKAAKRLGNTELQDLARKTKEREGLLKLYGDAYRRYCWIVKSVDDYRLAPFHLLATEGKVHSDKDHRWHMETLGRLCAHGSPVMLATPFKVLDLGKEDQCEEGIRWWREMTESGGEGIVVKPLDFIHRGQKGLSQPAVKCRGREYLRIIYGPEYTLGENLSRLRSRGLGTKRGLALNEFALGLEALERFVRHEPLRKVHECVFAVIGLESEPVDPRL